MTIPTLLEIIFDLSYLITIITLGILILHNRKSQPLLLLFGIMALVLGIGDAFHLIPRVYAHLRDGLASYPVALGIGKLITSLSMTIFYILLYHIAKGYYKIQNKTLTNTVYSLAILRIVLCLFPQNQWTLVDPSYQWNLYRNIPFLLLGILMMILFYYESKKYQTTTKKKSKKSEFSRMWLAILLSFAFYLPVVLWVDQFPPMGMLMIPKTIAYVWIVWMGYQLSKAN